MLGKLFFRHNRTAFIVPTDPKGQSTEATRIDVEDTGFAFHEDIVEYIQSDTLAAVTKVVTRTRTNLIGSVTRTSTGFLFKADDVRFTHWLMVVTPPTTLKPDDKVFIEILPWSKPGTAPTCGVIEVLGKQYHPTAELKAILRKYELPTQFPSGVQEAAQTIPPSVKLSPSELKSRRDFRSILTFTIDPDTAKDYDDALSYYVNEKGQEVVVVHVADVSHYIPQGSTLDLEAYKRGNSTYLIRTVIPMLPEALSNGVCSLQEGVDRLTKAVAFTFNKDGTIAKEEFFASIICSAKRMSYSQALQIIRSHGQRPVFSAPPSHSSSMGRDLNLLSPEEYAPLAQAVTQCHHLAQQLRRHRLANGSLELESPQFKFHLNEDGYAHVVSQDINDESHQLIEEFMLSANLSVGTALLKANIAVPYRVHPMTETERANEFTKFLFYFNLPAFEPADRKKTLQLLQHFKSHPMGPFLRNKLLRSTPKATYQPNPLGHYGLNFGPYTHFTSPIRRYVDLMVHRAFNQLVGLVPLQPNSAPTLMEQCLHLTGCEKRSTDAEREFLKVKSIEYCLRLDKKSDHVATITDINNAGIQIELSNLPLSGFIPFRKLGTGFYEADPAGHYIVNTTSKVITHVGSQVVVNLIKADQVKRQAEFKLAQSLP